MSSEKEVQCELLSPGGTGVSRHTAESLTAHRHDMLKMFRQQGHFIDVILVLEDKEFPAHSTVLAAFSPTLFVMLINPTEKNHKNQSVIYLDSFNIQLQSLVKIVDFMYDQNFQRLLSDVSVQDLRKDAHFLGILQIVEYINHEKEENQRNMNTKQDGVVPKECRTDSDITKPPLIEAKEDARHNNRKRKHFEAINPGKEPPRKMAKFEVKPSANNSKQTRSLDKAIEYSYQKTAAKTANRSESLINEVNTVDATQSTIISVAVKKECSEEIVDSLNQPTQDIVEAAIRATVSDILPEAVCLRNNTRENTTNRTKDKLTENISHPGNTAIVTEGNSAECINSSEYSTSAPDEKPIESTYKTVEENKVHTDAPSRSTPKTSDSPTDSSTKISEVNEESKSNTEEEEQDVKNLSQWDEFCIDGEYVCPHCPDQKWKYLNKLCHHMIHVHGEKPFECFQCGQKFSTKKHFTQHLNKHTEVKSYACSEDGCKKSFRTSNQLRAHQKAHSRKARTRQQQTYPCPVPGCGETLPTRQEQDSHLLTVHPESKSFSCPHCAVTCTTHSQLSKHVYTHTEDRTVVCEDCGKTMSKKNLKEHLLTHTPSTSLQCQYCTYATQHKRYMDSHMKRRHRSEMDGKETLKMHKCPLCQFSTFFASDFKTHKKKHLSEATLTCDVCAYKTSNVTLMKAHKRTHTNERPYICQICTKGFRQSTHLNRHSRLHTGDRPFVCTLCGRGFMDKRALVNHQYNDHANVNQFLCHLCAFECVKQETLRTHMKKSHGIETFIMNEKKNRREITVSGNELVIHDKPQYNSDDSNRMDPLIGDLKQMKEVVSDLVNLIPTTVDEHEPLESLLENPVPIDQSESSLDQVIDGIDQSEPSLGQVIGIDQSENPLQEVISAIDQSEATLPVSMPSPDESQSSLQNPVPDQSDPDSNRILAEDDVKLISKALQKGNVVLHFV